jgi:hypothetical protein
VDLFSAASPSGALDPAFPASREELELWPQIHLNPAYSDAAIHPSGPKKCGGDKCVRQKHAKTRCAEKISLAMGNPPTQFSQDLNSVTQLNS